jgi:hypothetical protein
VPIAPVAAPASAASAAPAVASGAARPSFGALLESRSPLRLSPPAAPAPHPAASALAAVERAQGRLDAVLAAARTGRTFTAAELLGLQAEAYRCVQTVDLAAKLVEQGAQSLKQALNTQL